MGYALKKMSKQDALRRRMIIDRRARKYCDMIFRYYMDGVLDTLRDKISAIIAKLASRISNPKVKKALLKIAGNVAAGKMQKASVGMKKVGAAIKRNPAIAGGAAAAAAISAGLMAALKLSKKFAEGATSLATTAATTAKSGVTEGIKNLAKGAKKVLIPEILASGTSMLAKRSKPFEKGGPLQRLSRLSTALSKR